MSFLLQFGKVAVIWDWGCIVLLNECYGDYKATSGLFISQSFWVSGSSGFVSSFCLAQCLGYLICIIKAAIFFRKGGALAVDSDIIGNAIPLPGSELGKTSGKTSSPKRGRWCRRNCEFCEESMADGSRKYLFGKTLEVYLDFMTWLCLSADSGYLIIRILRIHWWAKKKIFVSW